MEGDAGTSQLNPTDPSSSSTAQQAYIGNVNSKKFHLPTCANLPAEKNQVLFSSYDEAIAAGYTPCASCIKYKYFYKKIFSSHCSCFIIK